MKQCCQRLALAIFGAAGIIAGVASFSPTRPALIWNYSASAPVGLYWLLDRQWRKGDWVAVRVSPSVGVQRIQFHAGNPQHLLVKRVTAVYGDSVCREGTYVTINGALVARAALRSGANPLPAWFGCRRLQAHEVFLLGLTERSFDGRYFGITDVSDIIGPLARIAE